MRVVAKEGRKDLSNGQGERVDNVHGHLVAHLALPRGQGAGVGLKQGALANVKRLSICFVREHSGGLVGSLPIMGDPETSRMVGRDVWRLRIDAARWLERLPKVTSKNDARDATAPTSSTPRPMGSATDTGAAAVRERELCVVEDVFTRDRKRLKSRQKLIRV